MAVLLNYFGKCVKILERVQRSFRRFFGRLCCRKWLSIERGLKEELIETGKIMTGLNGVDKKLFILADYLMISGRTN